MTDLKNSRRQRQELSDRLPPSSIEAEQGVLGCALLSPKECVGECIEKLKAGPEVFYDLRHQAIFEALVEMFDRDPASISLITLLQHLKDQGKLDGVGGQAYLASLPDSAPSSAGI